MSFREMLLKKAAAAKEALEHVVASEELAAERMAICQDCPALTKLTRQCTECGCFVFAKTKLQHASCPLKKW